MTLSLRYSDIVRTVIAVCLLVLVLVELGVIPRAPMRLERRVPAATVTYGPPPMAN